VRVAASPVLGVSGGAVFIVLHADESPVIDRSPEPAVTGVPHHDLFALPALPGPRGDAGVGTQGVIVTVGQELGRFGEHCGRYTTPDSHQGTQNPNIARRPARPRGDTGFPEPSKQGVDLPSTAQSLITYEAQAWKKQSNVCARSFDGSRCDRKRWGRESGEHGSSVEPPDTMSA
jgi:hypothetical protein